MRASTYPLVDAEEAAAIVLDHTPVLDFEHRTLDACAGRVLAEDLMAPSALPAFPSSAVDGYAVRAADAGRTLRVIGESAAGLPFMEAVAPGTAATCTFPARGETPIASVTPRPAAADSRTIAAASHHRIRPLETDFVVDGLACLRTSPSTLAADCLWTWREGSRTAATSVAD